MSNEPFGYPSAPDPHAQLRAQLQAQQAAAQQASAQYPSGQLAPQELGGLPAPQPVAPGNQPLANSDLSEDAWKASLPSWGGPINIGPASPTAVAPPAVTPAASQAPQMQAAPMQTAQTQAAPAAPAFPVAPAPVPPSSLLGTGFGLGPAKLSGGQTLPAIDPSSDAAGLTQHTLTRTSGGFPVAAAPGASVAPPRTSAYQNWTPPPSTSNTAAVWWLVVSPIIFSVLMVVLAVLAFGPTFIAVLAELVQNPDAASAAVPASFVETYLGFLGVNAVASLVFLVASIWLGYRDRQALNQLGFTAAASPWWMLLSMFIYLIVRTVHVRRVTGGGQAPLVVYILVYVLPPILLSVGIVVLMVMTAGTTLS
ncbi:hypothetical protein FB562_0128 [Homoserinimonas aerilata]|uniref:Yip1 domain-containing protein n=1 Tax=Homoserinimonas aerilata TaxID=1162970 RepID=A0A542YG67_9MICO|nr:hypothetical protein [Homoserinimonas aerilata]TQL47082.1 hypothetical protein FB562_0128 [Homoserinimonas aerilata]